MEAIRELEKLRERIAAQLHTMQAEFDAVNKAIALLEREQRNEAGSMQSKRFAKAGLAQSIREIVRGSQFMKPTQIRDHMLEGGYVPTTKANLLNAVYATAKRLAVSGEFEKGKVNGKLAFRKREQASSGPNVGATPGAGTTAQ
jgi:hypothetical protein